MSEWPGFRATLLRGLPATTFMDIPAHSSIHKTSRQPLGQVPSVPWDLGAISEQHPHHGITQINTAKLLTVAGLCTVRLHELRTPTQLHHHHIQCIYSYVSYLQYPGHNCR
jgi:hypothetical protein